MLRRHWRKVRSQWWIVPAGMFTGIRAGTFIEAWLIHRNRPAENGIAIISQWDAGWYSVIARQGYVGPSPSTGKWMTFAFFPIVPRTGRLINQLTGISIELSGIFLSFICGLGAAVVLWKLIERRYSSEVADNSILLLFVAPYAFVFSMFYAEGATLFMIALCFYALDRRWWIPAGLFALLAGGMRPNGFLLVVPCLAAAIIAIRESSKRGERRPWIALTAPALAPIGFVAWVIYVGRRTGNLTEYFEIQRVGWGSRVDFGRQTWDSIWSFVFREPLGTNATVNIAMLAVGLLGLILCWRQRINPVWFSYAVVCFLLPALSVWQASAGRFLLLAFPLFVAFALSIPRRWYPTVVAMSAVLMGAFFYSATGPGTLTP